MHYYIATAIISGGFAILNLSLYAWGQHDPAALAMGIASGFAMLLCVQFIRPSR